MNAKRARLLLTIASYMTLASLLLMVWGFVGKGPMPIFVSMSVGQVVGTVAFLMYLMVVVPELWRLGEARQPDSPADGAADERGDDTAAPGKGNST